MTMLSKIRLPLLLAASLALVCPAAAKEPATAPAATSTKSQAKPSLLDINTASKAALTALKGIGDKRAGDIIAGRPYKGKDELVQKKIIPQSVYSGIKDQIIAKQKP